MENSTATPETMTSTSSTSRLSARGLFVTGTDTGVGKTQVAVALIEALKQKGLRVAGMKPVAAGLSEAGENEDVSSLMQSANVNALIEEVSPYRLRLPLSPHIAAQQAGVDIQLGAIEVAYRSLAARSDWVVVEGAGGFLAPLSQTQSMDVIPMRLELSVILVVGMRLGCLNHALLTAEAVRRRGLSLTGWVANQVDPSMAALNENLETLKSRLDAPCLGVIPWIADASSRCLMHRYVLVDELVGSA